MLAIPLPYYSAEEKTKEQAEVYVKTHETSHRYLAYKDIPILLRQFVRGNHALDYGTGTGASASFLYKLGFDVIGTDVSVNMLEKAHNNFPYIKFQHINELGSVAKFDLVFSSFVLLELSSKKKIIRYLSAASSFLKEGGVFIAITSSEHLYSLSRRWSNFDVNFIENYNLSSGKLAKLAMKFPKMEFYDYFWKEADYLECFRKAGLSILQTHHPYGSPKDPYFWEDESFCSPFVIFVAKKSDKILDKRHRLQNKKGITITNLQIKERLD